MQTFERENEVEIKPVFSVVVFDSQSIKMRRKKKLSTIINIETWMCKEQSPIESQIKKKKKSIKLYMLKCRRYCRRLIKNIHMERRQSNEKRRKQKKTIICFSFSYSAFFQGK
jgi:hypothetical protein